MKRIKYRAHFITSFLCHLPRAVGVEPAQGGCRAVGSSPEMDSLRRAGDTRLPLIGLSFVILVIYFSLSCCWYRKDLVNFFLISLILTWHCCAVGEPSYAALQMLSNSGWTWVSNRIPLHLALGISVDSAVLAEDIKHLSNFNWKGLNWNLYLLLKVEAELSGLRLLLMVE